MKISDLENLKFLWITSKQLGSSSHKAKIPKKGIPVEPRVSSVTTIKSSNNDFNSTLSIKSSQKTLNPLKTTKKLCESIDYKNRPISPWEMFSITPPKKKSGYVIDFDKKPDRFPKGKSSFGNISFFEPLSVDKLETIEKATKGTK